MQALDNMVLEEERVSVAGRTGMASFLEAAGEGSILGLCSAVVLRIDSDETSDGVLLVVARSSMRVRGATWSLQILVGLNFQNPRWAGHASNSSVVCAGA